MQAPVEVVVVVDALLADVHVDDARRPLDGVRDAGRRVGVPLHHVEVAGHQSTGPVFGTTFKV